MSGAICHPGALDWFLIASAGLFWLLVVIVGGIYIASAIDGWLNG